MPAALFYTGPSLRALHEDYAKNSRIDAAAPLTVTSSIIIDAPPDQVWAVLSDVAAWPAWHPAMTVFSLDAVRPDATLRWKLGPAPDGRTTATMRESLAGPLLPLLFSRAKLEAAHQPWLADLKTRVENGQ
jgi:polyketide cyclase/dehydrase/lipid transport protein